MRTINRDLIFSTQFHTCAIEERDITFYRGDLDYACEGRHHLTWFNASDAFFQFLFSLHQFLFSLYFISIVFTSVT